MASAWTANGPVSLPPRALAYFAGLVVVVLAVVGVVTGYEAARRQPLEPGAIVDASSAGDDTLTAHPIVELPAPATAATPDDDKADDARADAEDLAAQATAAQAVQAKAAKPAGNIDDILTSPAEKPPPPAKTQAEEAPPPAPVKSDVPF